jgi:nucleoside 2-deoxyribosyltransferase
MSRPRLYLAGPDVFLPDPLAAAAAMKAICEELGLEGLFPIDNALVPAPHEPGTSFAARIRQANLDLIRAADGVIANCSPFRGPSVDDGTAYEMGYATALGKPVFPWSGDIRPLLQRTQARQYLAHDGRVWRDAEQMEVEEFGLPVNLMLVDPATGPVAGSFILAAQSAAAWFLTKDN